MTSRAVAVGILRDPADGRVLVAHRHAQRHQGGGLEFPGGKIEPGESAAGAIARELREELGVHPTRFEPLIRVRHAYDDRQVELHTFLVHAWEGAARGIEGQAIDWLDPAELSSARFPAANRPIVAALRFPPHYLITPPPAGGGARDRQRIADGVRRAAGAGTRLVQLRAPAAGSRAWHALTEAVANAVRAQPGCRLLVNAPAAAAPDLPAGAGIHLSASELSRLPERPAEWQRLLGCSCHDAGELARAERLGADLAVLGPVHPTPSHPRAAGIGWRGFRDLAAGTSLPLYALGGVEPGDLPTARTAGAIGVAGIRAFWPSDE